MEQAKLFSIIMAGGKGQRMQCPGHNKVCLDIEGVPAIVRLLDTCESAGIGHHIIVVGELAEQVLEVVGERYPNCTFAYQPVPLGTGNATKVGARVLQDAGYKGTVFVTAGDKYLEPQVVRELAERFEAGGYDLMLVAGKTGDYPTSGRILLDDDGAPAAIVEVSEIKLSAALQAMEGLLTGQNVAPAELRKIIERYFPNEQKAKVAFGELWPLVSNNVMISYKKVEQICTDIAKTVTIPLWHQGHYEAIPASATEELTDLANICAYMYRAPALYFSLHRLTRDNAQHEEFLTDTVKILAAERREDGNPAYRLGVLQVTDPRQVMGFNTPEELEQIRQVVQQKRQIANAVHELPRQMRPISEWHHLFTTAGEDMHAFMDQVYGSDRALHEQKRQEYLGALELYWSRLGRDDDALLIRTPGRLNLMGRHTDHRGSRTNMIAISQEVLMVASPRTDDQISLYNTAEQQFHQTGFSIGRELDRLDYGDWLSMVRSPKALQIVGNGDWANYVKAPALRLQKEFPDRALRGADIVLHGTIPIGSGLSSSSAVVVGAAEALIALNDLPVRPAAMVDLCGEGEWFVGTRGGSSDHAAIKFARRGQVAHVSFFPFEVKEFAPFFADHALVVCNSGIQAKKSEGARDAYNSRVLGYTIGEILFKRFHPQYASRIEHLRDITTDHLGITLADLYRMLQRLPLEISECELSDRFGPFEEQESAKLQSLLESLDDRTHAFPVRGVMLYGLAECARSRLCLDLLKRGEADALGRLWSLSHDGDRVVAYDAQWQARPFAGACDDDFFKDLIKSLESDQTSRDDRAAIELQIGCYACSTPEIDLIVDLALRMPGVKGAQISGAGLGGCVMILVENSHREAVVSTLRSRGLPTEPQAPVAGSGPVAI